MASPNANQNERAESQFDSHEIDPPILFSASQVAPILPRRETASSASHHGNVFGTIQVLFRLFLHHDESVSKERGGHLVYSLIVSNTLDEG